MKKKILFAAGLLCMLISFHSCELSNCQVCNQVKYDNQSGDVISEGTEAEYCDGELLAIKATPDVPIGNTTTKWECR